MRSSFARWRTRFFIAFVLATALFAAGLAGGYAYINAKWSQAHSIKLKLHEGSANFLVLGSDSREFAKSEQDRASFGEVGGTRADTLIVVRIDPDTKNALLVSFPRDLWVDIPDLGYSKINAAFNEGPQKVVDTLKHNFDIPIHHYLQVDFAGFRNIVSAMGGVNMFVAAPSRDSLTGLDIQQAGCVTLSGDQALAWVRSRHYQSLEGGVWRSDPTGDFGRIERQQDFIRRLIAQAIESAATNPVRGNRLVDRGLENITVDSELDVSEVLTLVRVFRSSDPDKIEMVTVPGDVGYEAGQSVVVTKPEADGVFAKLRGDVPIGGDAAPNTVKVRVLNGTGGPSLATNTAGALQAAGFIPGGAADAPEFGHVTTEIRYRPGQQAAAELVQRHLKGIGEVIEDGTVASTDVVVVVGEDFQGVGKGKADPPDTEPPTTTTTEPTDDSGVPDARPAGEC